MSDIFQEVEEDLRRETYIRLWIAYGKYLVAVIVAVVLGTATGVGYREYTSSEINQASDQYEDALALLRGGQEEQALSGFSQLAQDSDGIYAVLALMREAAALGSSGNRDRAIELYDQVATGKTGAPEILKDLAALRAAMLVIDSASSDEVASRLEALAHDDRPFKFSARELQGLLELRNGNQKAAGKIFTRLAEDGAAPTGIRARAAALGASVRGAP